MLRKFTRALRVTALVAILAATLGGAALVGSGSSVEPKAAEAGPTAMLGLNKDMCVAMAVAFAGLADLDALSACGVMMVQDAESSFQKLVRCLRGADKDLSTEERDSNVTCLLTGPTPLRPDPSEFAVIDRDKNYVHGSQQLIVMAFVNDDAPVRFHTDTGVLLNNPLYLGTRTPGKDFYCETASPLTNGDPDCDGDPATVGDGVVVGVIEFDLIPDEDELGDFEVMAIQEGIAFPMTFRVQDVPETMSLDYLFGKGTIQTGATDPPEPGEPVEATDCVFAGSTAGVLGAINSPYKAIILIKSLTQDGEEVIGTLFNWEPLFKTASGDDESKIGGVALPSTPTLDTGAIGIGFPQFVCGKEEPGTLTLKVEVNTLLSGNAEFEQDEIDVTVVGPPATMELTADPKAIACDGTQTSKVTATLKRADGGNPANGADVAFSAVALGSVNPLVADTTDGVATTTVSPLSNVGRGVTVLAEVDDASLDDPIKGSILVECLPGGAAPPPAGQPAPGGGAAPGSGRPGGTITGPDTGSGGDLDGRGALSAWPAVALFVGAMGLAGARFALRRTD